MDEKQMLAFVEKNVTQQGNEGSINVTPFYLAVIEQLFKDPIAGVTPIVVNIAQDGEKIGTRTTYDVITPQPLIDAFVTSAYENQEKTRLFVEDNGALIGFNHVEIAENSVTGKVMLHDGESVVVITKEVGKSYFYHEEKIDAIPQVTVGEIEAYDMIFGAKYDKFDNVYKLVVGATEFPLTPAEMIIVNEEYNKTSTDGNYTAMWANSIAKYICCPKWFDGFHQFNLHSAFYNAKKVTFIDINTEILDVGDLTNAFFGCSDLQQISGIIEVTQGTRLMDVFKGCTNLRTFKIHGLASNLDLSDCPMLAYEVFEDLITYAAFTRVTVTVHPDVMNNINNNPLWNDVKVAMDRKPSFNITTK